MIPLLNPNRKAGLSSHERIPLLSLQNLRQSIPRISMLSSLAYRDYPVLRLHLRRDDAFMECLRFVALSNMLKPIGSPLAATG
jgi:hypothetical protein